MNPIESNAIRLLELMVKNEKELFENTWLQENSGLTPRDINDAVRNVSSRMRHFLQEFSVEPPRFLEAVC